MATETKTTVTVTAMDQRIVTGTDRVTGMPTALLVTNTDTTTATLTTRMITNLGPEPIALMLTRMETDPAFTVMTDSLTLCFPPLMSRRRR
jgi:hypothetical protein